MRKLIPLVFCLFVAFMCSANAQIVDLSVAYPDSTAFKDRTIPGSKLTNPLRIPGDVAITGRLGVGEGTLPNAKTVFSIYPTAAQGDTLQSWKNSRGFVLANVDTLGIWGFFDDNNTAYKAWIAPYANGISVFGNSKPTSRAGAATGHVRAYGFNLGNGAAGTWQSNIFRMTRTSVHGWVSAENATVASDTGVFRFGAAKVGIGNGTWGDLSGSLLARQIGINDSTATATLRVKGDKTLGDSLTVWRSSLGNTVAWVDTTGKGSFLGGLTTGGSAYSQLGYLQSANGIATAPTYSFLYDTDTGIYSPVSRGNRMVFGTGAVVRGAVDSLGIHSYPAFDVRLSVNSDTSDSSLTVTLPSGVPTLSFFGTDDDTYTQSINTNDQAVFAGASGGYSFDAGASIGKYLGLTAISALSDTTAWVGPRLFIQGGDTLYMYKADHTIKALGY